MTSLPPYSEDQDRRDSAWAGPISRLRVRETPIGAVNLNVEGRRLVGPLQGFGPLWQKTYSVALEGVDVTPKDLISTWKSDFPRFWPRGSRFYTPLTGITPGEVALINLPLVPGGAPLSTGVIVIFADDLSFAFMTPEGHMFAGMITFSAKALEGVTVAQAQVLIRANDPLWELASRVYAFRKEDEFWQQTMRALALHFGVDCVVGVERVCIDPRLQWSQAGNVWQNAAIRSVAFAALGPLRWASRQWNGRKSSRP